jgi:hypothetical protein
MPDTPPEQNSRSEFRRNHDLMVGLMTIFAFPVVLCTTRLGTWGTRYLGFHAVLGFIWPIVFATFHGRDPDVGAVAVFWQLSILLLLVHRIEGVRLRRRGYQRHTLYWGRSWFEPATVDLAKQRRARLLASLVAFIAGLVCIDAISRPLGILFVLGAVSKVVTDLLTFQATETRLRQMEDARIENDYYLELFRQRHGRY